MYLYTCTPRLVGEMDVIFCLLYSANNFALKSKRKTLSAGDVFSALQDMEFEEFVPELKDCLEGIFLYKSSSPLLSLLYSLQRRTERKKRSCC